MDNLKLLNKMIEFDAGDPKRIQHFIKVYEFARMIGISEGLSTRERHILETAAITHDIGIRPAERKFGSASGKLQEQEGPPAAEAMLAELGYDPEVIERVKYLIGHHHTYNDIQGLDYQILVEADFLVNLFEDNSQKSAAEHVRGTIFKTKSGTALLERMFL